MRNSFLLTCLLSCIILASCTDAPRKVSSGSSADVLRAIYEAKIDLNDYQKKAATRHLQTAKRYLPYFKSKPYGQSDLLVELTYLSHGAITKLYVPSVRGKKRFDETEEVLRALKKANIKPLEYRLVTFSRKKPSAHMASQLDKALLDLQDPKLTDVSKATIRADKKIDQFLKDLKVSPYTGSTKNRLAFHTKASELFLEHNAYDIARDAVKHANKAKKSMVKAKPKSKKQQKTTQSYEKRLEQIDKAIDKEDPSLLGKIGQTINKWFDSEDE